jgi:hypothetical protein
MMTFLGCPEYVSLREPGVNNIYQKSNNALKTKTATVNFSNYIKKLKIFKYDFLQ